MIRRYGKCKHPRLPPETRSSSYDPHIYCSSDTACKAIDMNMVCYKNATSPADKPGKCQCKPDMAWNKGNLQCEIYIDVDCRKYKYETKPSQIILEAVERPADVASILKSVPTTTPQNLNISTTESSAITSTTETSDTSTTTTLSTTTSTTTTESTTTTTETTSAVETTTSTTNNGTEENTGVEQFSPFGGLISSTKNGGLATSPKTQLPSDRTPTFEESLSDSLLAKLDKDKATEAEMEEAFCRDVDSFSFDLNQYDGRPPACKKIPSRACAMVFDSHDCGGGWSLEISSGQINFPYFSSYWKYRNDIDLVAVRAGCTFTGYSGSGFVGKRGVIQAGEHDVWIVLGETSHMLHLDEDIESIICKCNY